MALDLSSEPHPTEPVRAAPDADGDRAFGRLARIAAAALDAGAAALSARDGESLRTLGLHDPGGLCDSLPAGPLAWAGSVAASGAPLFLPDAAGPAPSHGPVRAAAIVPLLAGGSCWGCLSVFDARPRRWSPDQRRLLDDLAASAHPPGSGSAADLSRTTDDLDRLRGAHAALTRAAGDQRLLFESVAGSAPIGIAVLDADLRYLYMNPMMAGLIGLTPDEPIGRRPRDLFPAAAEAIEPLLRHVLETGEPFLNAERRSDAFSTALPRRRWLSSYYPARDSDGQNVGVSIVLDDITELKRTEQTLSEVAARARCILWSSVVEERNGELRWETEVSDVEGAQQVVPLDIPAGRRYAGTLSGHRHPDDRDRSHATGAAALRSGRPSYGQEYRVINRHGEVQWLQEAVAVEPRGLERWHAVGVCTDITERKAFEEALEESNFHLEEALAALERTQDRVVQQERLRAMGEMAAGIAHDFNNALSPILGFSDLLLLQPDVPEERARRYVRLIHTAAEDAASVVRRLREFYRPRDEREPFRPVPVSGLVEDAISLTAPRWKDQAMAEGRTIRVVAELQPTPPVAGDDAALREILTNLIFNAVDAMPEGGTVTVRSTLEDDRIRIEVRDTGHGMTDAVRRRCLDPFFTTKGDAGTGLGLSMVQGIVRRHGGTLEIETAVESGTAIVLHLPVWRGAPLEAHAGAAEVAAPPASLRILVVDDEPLVREVVVEALESAGCILEVAADGAAALERFRPGEFDVVLTDRAMPGVNGDQLALLIKRIDPGQPILLMTGFGDMMNFAGERPEGVDRVLCKPILVRALLEAVLEFPPRAP